METKYVTPISEGNVIEDLIAGSLMVITFTHMAKVALADERKKRKFAMPIRMVPVIEAIYAGLSTNMAKFLKGVMELKFVMPLLKEIASMERPVSFPMRST